MDCLLFLGVSTVLISAGFFTSPDGCGGSFISFRLSISPIISPVVDPGCQAGVVGSRPVPALLVASVGPLQFFDPIGWMWLVSLVVVSGSFGCFCLRVRRLRFFCFLVSSLLLWTSCAASSLFPHPFF